MQGPLSRSLAADLKDQIGQTVRLNGWLNTLRSIGTLSFLILRDRSGFAQIAIEDKDLGRQLDALQPGSILEITGMVRAAPNSDLGVELIQPQITIQVPVREVAPLDYSKPKIPSDLDVILDHRPISLRNREIQAVFRIQSAIAHAYSVYMHDIIHAVAYYPPNLIAASSEGGSEFFNVDYFGYTATLAQSSQLYKQIMVGVNERVYAIAPFFRAENSNTPRHLTEGKQLEFEMGFFDHWEDLLEILEQGIKYIVQYLQSHCSSELTLLGHPLVSCPADVPFPRLTFAEAQELYFQRTGVDDRHETDLSPAAERSLCEWAKETHQTSFVFITDWLASKRPFYSFPKEGDPTLTNTFDLLCGNAEIVSGGQRRHTHASMIEGILLKGLDPRQFEDYLSIFKFGMPPHGGFGMGLERLTMTLLQLKNIREASLFPSDPRRIASNRIRSKLVFGGENVRNEIVRLLRGRNIPFEHLEHVATSTSEESAHIRGTSPSQGIKALILRGKNSKKNYQFNIPADRKLDMKAVADLVGEKCEFEDPKTIEERFGLTVGGIPPFGNLLHLETFFDTHLQEKGQSAFNCGLVTESILCPTEAILSIVQPKFAELVKE